MTAVALWHGLTNGLPKREGKIDEPSRDPPIAAEAVLKDAELFLHHAASTGLPIDPTVRDAIITARMEITNATLGKEHLGDLYAAYSSLAIAAKPVTVETIRACRDLALGALKRYRRYVFSLTVVAIVLSMASFMASAITEKIGDDITAANKLAVQLTAELGPLPEPRNLDTQLLAYEPSKVAEAIPDEATPAKDFSTWRAQVPSGLNITEVISQLQQFTALMREIHDRARSAHSVAGVSDPFVTLRANHRDDFWRLFQLPAASTNLRQTTSDKIYLFQRIRVFGNEVHFNISKFNGAIGAYLLPILYAVLGAFAYGLRKFHEYDLSSVSSQCGAYCYCYDLRHHRRTI
jgi:hypothetical protein